MTISRLESPTDLKGMLAHSSFGISGGWVKTQLRSKVNGDNQRGRGESRVTPLGCNYLCFLNLSIFFLLL